MASKQDARRFQKDSLDSLSSRDEKEESIRKNLIEVLRHRSSDLKQKIITYVPDRFEISPFPSFGEMKDLEFDFYYPKITESGLEFLSGETFGKGPYGIPEPSGNRKILPKEADWIIVPALGWNREGARLGRGKGFYDRSLKDISAEKMIGLSFEELYPCDFSAEAHDLRVGQVITDKKNHCFPKKMGEKSVP